MRRAKFSSILGALGLGALPAHPAHAFTMEWEDIIPASACQLEDEEDIGKADLVDGSWLIDASTANDEVELLCPVRIAPFYVEGMTKTDLNWSRWEILYRDPDGTSTSHSVIASLLEIQDSPTLPTLHDTISSNASSTTTDTRWQENLAVWSNSLNDAQHFIRVVMKQGSNDGSNRVRFTRVRLFAAPPGSP